MPWQLTWPLSTCTLCAVHLTDCEGSCTAFTSTFSPTKGALPTTALEKQNVQQLSMQLYRNAMFNAKHLEMKTNLIAKRTSRSTVPWWSCSCVTTPVKTRCLICEDWLITHLLRFFYICRTHLDRLVGVNQDWCYLDISGISSVMYFRVKTTHFPSPGHESINHSFNLLAKNTSGDYLDIK